MSDRRCSVCECFSVASTFKCQLECQLDPKCFFFTFSGGPDSGLCNLKKTTGNKAVVKPLVEAVSGPKFCWVMLLCGATRGKNFVLWSDPYIDRYQLNYYTAFVVLYFIEYILSMPRCFHCFGPMRQNFKSSKCNFWW